MRATKKNRYDTATAENMTKASRNRRKVIKATSVGCAVVIAAAAFIVPTTALAPDVEAFTDSRVASYSVGSIDKFSSIITKNCVEPDVDPTTVAPVKTKVSVKPAAKTTAKTPAATTPAATAPKTQTKANSAAATSVTGATEPQINVRPKSVDTSAATTTNSNNNAGYRDDYDDDYGNGYKSNNSSSYTDDDYDYSYGDDDYGYDDSSYVAPSKSSSSSYSGSALMGIANPDYSYTPTHISLTSYDRAKLERLVMGEAGTMGFTGCAIVAQAIRDSMVRSHTSSIDYIIDEYQYFGDTHIEPNSDVLSAVSYIFDEDGVAVQHRVMCFYIGSSAWHETQTFLCEIDGVRFFDLNVA